MEEINDIINKISPFYKKKKGPSIEYNLGYDSPTETLEPVYFWILDFMNKSFDKVEKIVDNFASSPGSGHFSDLQGKASHMQQEASRVLGTVNSILKGIINLIYDLKEFKIRLSHYEAANSKDKETREAGLLALKQIWIDKVDIQRGVGSINALTSGNLQFVTLRDAFMTVNSVEEVDKLDLNDRVKRILKPRVQEFLEWKKRSEQELKKRYELEKIYLKSQVDALKLNARWAKPYLRAAERLTSNEELLSKPDLVSVFNTILLELCLMGIGEFSVKDAVFEKEPTKKLPKEFLKMKNLRKYYQVVFVDLNFRGIPSRLGQNYVFGGKVNVRFRAYALNEDEILLLKEELSDNDLEYGLKLVEGMTDQSLLQIKADIEEILNEKSEEEKEKSVDILDAFFSILSPKKEKKDEKDKQKEKIEKLKKKGIPKDNYAEEYIRNLTEADSKNTCLSIYETYKKTHGMVSFPYFEGFFGKAPRSAAEKFFGLNQPIR